MVSPRFDIKARLKVVGWLVEFKRNGWLVEFILSGMLQQCWTHLDETHICKDYLLYFCFQTVSGAILMFMTVKVVKVVALKTNKK